MKIPVVVEKTPTGYSAYSPDVDGCVAAGSSLDEVEQLMREAVAFHFEGLKAEGLTVPEPQSHVLYIEVAA